MSPRQKQLILITLFLATTALIAAAIIFILFRAPTLTETPLTPSTPTDGTGQLPGAGPSTGGNIIPDEQTETGTQTLPGSDVASGGLTNTQQLTTGRITTPTVTGNSVTYYDPQDGRFYQIDANGNIIELTSAQFPSARNVAIAPNGSTAAIEFPDGSNILYNFTTGKQVNLPNHWQEFDFAPSSTEVISKSVGIDPNNRALVITSSDGSKTTPIAALGNNADKVTLNWSPNNQIVGFSDTGSVQSAFGRKQIFLIGNDGSEKGALIVEGGNFSGLWSPSGNNILYSIAYTARNNRPSLWVANATGDVGNQRKYLNLETWVEKCTFQNETTVICAVPREALDESGFDHDMIRANDDVYTIDLASGRTTLLATPTTESQMTNLSISSDGNTLYYTDQRGRLNSLRLR